MGWKYDFKEEKIMNIKAIVIIMILIIISSVSIVVAYDTNNSDVNSIEENNSISDSMIPTHHSLHHLHNHNDKNMVKNDFTIDGYLSKFIE